MSLEIKNDKAWWSTDPKYPSIQLGKGQIHSKAADNFLAAFPKLNTFVNSYVSMEELGYVRSWIDKDLIVEGRKDAIRKILPDILRFVKDNLSIKRIYFDYYTNTPPKDKFPNLKMYIYEVNSRALGNLMREIS